jgi:hypothetical protein
MSLKGAVQDYLANYSNRHTSHLTVQSWLNGTLLLLLLLMDVHDSYAVSRTTMLTIP